LHRSRNRSPRRAVHFLPAWPQVRALVVGFSTFADVAPGNAPAPNPFSAYLRISLDETVTIYSSQMDMGEGIYHDIATLVQEQSRCDPRFGHVDDLFFYRRHHRPVPGNVALKGASKLYVGAETLPRYHSAPKSTGKRSVRSHETGRLGGQALSAFTRRVPLRPPLQRSATTGAFSNARPRWRS
jgi:hypothetical protein